jgi:AraC-like DNA-binding protein
MEQVLRFARDSGIDMRRLFSESGFQEEWLSRSEAWLSLQEVEPLMTRAIDLLNDPLAGLHASSHITLTSFGVMGFVVQTSSSLRELIETSQRYEKLISDIGNTFLSYEPGTAFWQWHCSMNSAFLRRHATECILAVWVNHLSLVRQATKSQLIAVRFTHSLPDPSLYPAYVDFFGCPVHFDQEKSGLIFPVSLLSEPLTLSNPLLHQTLSQHAHHLLQSQQSQPSIVAQVREALSDFFAQEITPDREVLAKKLGMSGRTLHRKLEEAGTSYRDMLDDLRLQRACDHLMKIENTVDVISQQLGFQESQSFIRWFKRLKGVTPGEYRHHAS